MDMKLDLVAYSQPNSSACTDFSDFENDTKKSTVFEIDLSRPKKLLKALRDASGLEINKLDCYPLFWCQQEKVSQKWAVTVQQRVACKYYVLKLISRAPGSSTHDANLDMFPLEFHGYKMPIPNTPEEQELLDEKLMGSGNPYLGITPPRTGDSPAKYDGFNMMNTHDEIAMLTGQNPLPKPVKMDLYDLQHSKVSDEPQLMYEGVKIDFYPKQIKVKADWTDQGYGNKKSRLFLSIYRNDVQVHQQDLFGICNRGDPSQSEREYSTADDVVNKCKPGDTYKIYGVSGGGGGHAIKVMRIEVTIFAKANDKRAPAVTTSSSPLNDLFAGDDEYY